VNDIQTGQITRIPYLIIESEHEYKPNTQITRKHRIEGALRLRLDFDPCCNTEYVDKLTITGKSNDFLEGSSEILKHKRQGKNRIKNFKRKEYSWAPIVIDDDKFTEEFTSDEGNSQWGYYITGRFNAVLTRIHAILTPL